MSVYVDEMQPVAGKAPHWPWRTYCHMLADSDSELEDMARCLNLPKRWRQGDHYDLTASKRAKALQRGAVAVSLPEIVAIRRKIRRDPR